MTKNEFRLCRGKWGQYGDKGRVKIREGGPVKVLDKDEQEGTVLMAVQYTYSIVLKSLDEVVRVVKEDIMSNLLEMFCNTYLAINYF